MASVDGKHGSAPWYKNTVVEYAKHSVRRQNMSSCVLSKVLVIYCGGTIGMLNDAVHGYYPVAGHLSALLARSDTFNDPAFQEHLQRGLSNDSDYDVSSMSSGRGPILVLPPSIYGKRIAYQILEYDPLKDSSNMSMDDWIRLASDIEAHYHSYDAFVILHGTDTMAYSASALSFLLENLGKTVILTGSQIPFSEIRNDAKDNLLGALTMAGHYVIPEVCLFFGNRLYRGNRTSKVSAVGFAAFDSPNLKPLAKLGVNVEIEWAEVLRATEIRPFRAHKQMDANVGCLRIFPGISAGSLRAFLRAPMRGVVLETFGTGNAPDDRPEIVRAIADAVEAGVVVVNVTQCPKGRVANVYATGNTLSSIGVLSGSDMTTECALAKLSYLLSFPENGPEEMRRLMVESLRGELTTPIASGASGEEGTSWLGAVLGTSLLAATAGHREAVDNTLRPLLFHLAAATGDLEALGDLLRSSFYIDAVDYDGRTALHVAVSQGQREAVRWLITHGANVHVRDGHGHTAVGGGEFIRAAHHHLGV